MPSSVSQQALLGQLVHVKSKSKHPNPTAQSARLIPEVGWIPLADSPVGKGSNPALTFLQGAPVTPAHTILTHAVAPPAPVFRSHPSVNSGFEQQKPTHRPIIVFQQQNQHKQSKISHHTPTPTKLHHTPTKLHSTFEQLINSHGIPTKDPITINPKQDTIVIQYNSIREQRQTQPLSFDERIDLLPLDCKAEVKLLIKDILQAPIRKRNSLLGMLKMKESIANSNNKDRLQQQQSQRPKNTRRPQKTEEQPRSKPHDVVSQTFSNFPGFQKESKPDQNQVREPKNFRPAPTTTQRPRPAITLEPFTLPPLTEPPRPPPPQTLPPKRFVPEQIFSSEESQNESQEEVSRQSGLSIEQFLKNYPEVRRVSSRFGDGTADTERVVGNLLVHKNQREERKNNGALRNNNSGKPKRRKQNRNRPQRPRPKTTSRPTTTTRRPTTTTTRRTTTST